jgi:NAD(P)-dependent dehydrogenase (short-subunit alcohol dehydrogenase family)
MVLVTTYNPDTDIPDQKGKVFFITGGKTNSLNYLVASHLTMLPGTSGIGKSTILNLAKHNSSDIFFTGRNAKNAEAVIAEVKAINPKTKIEFYPCDLSSLAAVSSTANRFLATKPSRLDVLICNAGIMGGRPGLSAEGFEIQFATNFLSHALLTKLFLPLLSETSSRYGEARILNLTSEAMFFCPSAGVVLSDLRTTQTNISYFSFLGKWLRYGQSKMAQTLYTTQLAEHYPNVTSVAVNPGVVATGLINDLPVLDRWFIKLATWGKEIEVEQGPWSTLWAATNTEVESGKAYSPVGLELELKAQAGDEQLARDVWMWTEEKLEKWA